MTPSYNLKNAIRKATPTLGSLIGKVKDRVETERVLDALDLKQKLGLRLDGTEWRGECPTGHESQSHESFNLSDTHGVFHCWNCGIGGDLISLVGMVEYVGVKEASRLLAERFAPDLLPEFDVVDADLTPEEKEALERAVLYRLIYEEGHRQLFQPEGHEALAYLTAERGYDAALLEKTEWIYWDTEANLRAYLRKVAPSKEGMIADLPLHGAYGDRFRLAVPFRDRHGVIRGFLKRAHVKEGFEVKGKTGIRYDSTAGLRKTDPFGMHRIRRQDELVLVEGYPDATYLPALGVNNVVALGQAAFSEAYIAGMESVGVRRLILALDNDGGTGIANTERICTLFAPSDIKVFVLDPMLLGNHKDPDEYVKANGIDAFRQLLEKAQTGCAWMASRVLAKHDITTDVGRERAIAEVLEFADTVASARDAEMILRLLAERLNLTDEVLAEDFKRLQERQASERLKEGLRVAGRKAEHAVMEGDPDRAVQGLQDDVSALRVAYNRVNEPEVLSLGDFLAQKRARDSERIPGERIGYDLTDFAEIAKEIQGLQSGLYVIAADPNIGKTAFMVSLALDVLKSNPKACCLFYSMDDSRDVIINRMLANLTDMRINEVRFRPEDPAKQKLLDDAYGLLSDWDRAGRLDVREGTAGLTMSRIHEEIRTHAHRDDAVAFIDGVFNVPLDVDFDSIRVQNIERANQVKQIVRSFDIPMIVTAEFRKEGRDEAYRAKKERTLHDIMETGKYGYNADLAILLSPKHPDAYKQEDEPIIIADFGKNKLESFRGSMELKFIRAKSAITLVAGSKIQQ